jgi:hypothetical protein
MQTNIVLKARMEATCILQERSAENFDWNGRILFIFLWRISFTVDLFGTYALVIEKSSSIFFAVTIPPATWRFKDQPFTWQDFHTTDGIQFLDSAILLYPLLPARLPWVPSLHAIRTLDAMLGK